MANPSSPAPELAFRVRLGVAMSGGLCIAVIRLIEAGFYLGQNTAVITGGLLSAAGTLLIATVGTIWIADGTTTKGLFLQSLAIPGLLVATLHQSEHAGSAPSAVTAPSAVPSLTPASAPGGRVGEVYTARLGGTVAWTLSAQDAARITTLERRDVSGGLADGARIYLGARTDRAAFTVAVGRTSDSAVAAGLAIRLRAAGFQDVALVRAAGSSDIYVSIGGLVSAEHAVALRDQARRFALDVFAAGPRATEAQRATAPTVAGAAVIDTRELFTRRP